MASVNKSILWSRWVALQRVTGDFPPKVPKRPRTANLSYILESASFSLLYILIDLANPFKYNNYGLSVSGRKLDNYNRYFDLISPDYSLYKGGR